MTTFHPFGGQTYNLQSSIGSTDTTITLSSFTEPVSGTPYTMALINSDIAYGTISPRTTSSEFISFTGITQNADGTATLTGVVRGLAKKSPFTTSSTFKLPHSGQSIFIISDAPQVFEKYMVNENAETVTGLKTFSQTPASTAGLPVNATDLATKQYVDNTATGTTFVNRVVTAATAGETITKDQIVYLKASDGRWWLADADISTTDENVILGIAQGAGSAGVAITSGVLTYGFATFTAITVTANTKYYVSNTAGAFSNTPGTTEVTAGYALSTTTFFFAPRYDQQLTEDQQDALVGDSGTPSDTNRFVTQKGLQINAEKYIADASGSSTAYTATLSPAPTALVTGMVVYVKIGLANTTATPTLNVNGLGAATIVKATSTALAVGDIASNMFCTFQYNGTQWVMMNPVAVPMVTIPFQSIPLYSGTSTGFLPVVQSNGTTTFIAYYSGGTDVIIFRLLTDSVTGQLYMTHTATWTLSTGTLDSLSLGITTSYLYAVIRDNGTMTLRRWDIADLANPTAITISGATGTLAGDGTGFSDGTDLYFYKGTASTLQKYTISGTTATNAANVAFTSSDFNSGTSTCNGTFVYNSVFSAGVFTVRKYVVAGGAVVSTTTFRMVASVYPNSTPAVPTVFIRNSTSLGYSYSHSNCSATAIIGYSAEVSAVALP